MQLQQQLAAVSFPLHKLYETEFDPVTFVRFCKSSASDADFLPKLRSELQGFLKDTRKKLEGLVQRDFERLLGIPQKLSSVDSSMMEAIHKLEVQAVTYSTRSVQIQKSSESAAGKVAKLKEVEARIKKLESTLEVEKCLATLDRVVPTLSAKSHLAEIERAARLVETCKKLRLDDYWGRVSLHKNSLVKLLEREVKTVLTTEDPGKRLGTLMRCLSHLDATEAAELMLTELYLRPLIEETFAQAQGSADRVSGFLSSVLAQLSTGKLSLVNVLGASHPSLHVFTKCLWPCLKDVLSEELKETVPTFFKEFSSAFTIFIGFIRSCEEILSPEELQFLLNSTSYKGFLGKWNLGTYFSLRQHDIIRPLTSALNSKSLDDFLRTSPHELSWAALEKCWEAELYIPQIAFRFLRLTFQIVSRYVGFVNKKLNEQSKAGQVNAGTLVKLLEGINWLRSSIAERLEGLCVDLSRDVVEECCDLLAKVSEPCMRCLSDLVTKQVCGNLDILRSIPSLYRLTNKPVPTEASTAIGKVLQPYQDVKHVFNQPGYETRLLDKVIVKCFEVFAEVSEDIQKSKEMLSKYQAEGQDDALKMKTQLALDIAAFVKLMEGSGMQTSGVLIQLASQAVALIN